MPSPIDRKSLIVAIVSVLFGGAGVKGIEFLLANREPVPHLRVRLQKAMPNPGTKRNVQTVYVDNRGDGTAKDVVVRINYERTLSGQPIDYAVDCPVPPETELREDSYLLLKFKRLVPGAMIGITVTQRFGTLRPSQIYVEHSRGKVESNDFVDASRALATQ